MKIHTSTIRYAGQDRLDITVKSGDRAFAPTWEMVMGYKNGSISATEYRKLYIALMRVSYVEHKQRWLEVLGMDNVTFCCYCRAGDFCHRAILAELFAAVGKANNVPVEVCGER